MTRFLTSLINYMLLQHRLTQSREFALCTDTGTHRIANDTSSCRRRLIVGSVARKPARLVDLLASPRLIPLATHHHNLFRAHCSFSLRRPALDLTKKMGWTEMSRLR